MEPAAADRLIQDRELSPSDDSFAIHRLGESDPIGIISLMNISRSKGSADLSIIVGPEEARRQGYGPEAIGLLLDYGFERLGLQRVGLSVFEFNETAILTYQRLGFHKEGRLRQAVEREGILHDAILMSLPKSEWSGSNRRRRT